MAGLLTVHLRRKFRARFDFPQNYAAEPRCDSPDFARIIPAPKLCATGRVELTNSGVAGNFAEIDMGWSSLQPLERADDSYCANCAAGAYANPPPGGFFVAALERQINERWKGEAMDGAQPASFLPRTRRENRFRLQLISVEALHQ